MFRNIKFKMYIVIKKNQKLKKCDNIDCISKSFFALKLHCVKKYHFNNSVDTEINIKICIT